MLKKQMFIIVLSVLLLVCGASYAADNISIAVSIVPQESFVRAVAGDTVNVVTMIPPGASPENYEPSPFEKAVFDESLIYFTIGVPTEDTNILPYVNKNTKIISMADICSQVYPDLKIGESRDPHIWLSPKRAELMVDSICNELCIILPENAEIYKENTMNYKLELQELNAYISSKFANIANRKFISFHPSFGYFADDYNLEMISLEQDGKEAVPQQLQKIIDLSKKENIKAVFYQSEISSNQVQAFAEEINAETIMLSPLASNYIENLRTMTDLMSAVLE